MSGCERIVSVVGGYGIFGGRVAQALALEGNCRVRVVGRRARIGANFAHRIGAEFRECRDSSVQALRPAIDGSFLVIHAAGPFQQADYQVAELCIEMGAHYLDLADAREFVVEIGRLDAAARGRGLMVASGVSSTPAITSTLIAHLAPEFSRIESIHTALSPGNQNPRGEATIAAVLSYLGRTIRFWQDGKWVERPGWGDVAWLTFPPPVGRRRVHNCEVPELELFPEHFQARTVRFSAGLELNVLNYLLSFCARLGRWFKIDFTRRAKFFLNASLMLFPLGTTNGALGIWVTGRDRDGNLIERKIALVTDFDGPATPSAAAIILARKLLRDGPPRVGAFPCVGLLEFDELIEQLRPLLIWCAEGDEQGWRVRERSAGRPGS
jgi:Saccharopine dehydrogenase NADP binding domain